jgi:hypothetical protein
MKNIINAFSIVITLAAFSLFSFTGCERDFDELDEATYPTNADVFIDGFSAGLDYEAWGDVTAFDVDYSTSYMGSASMKFAVPDEGQTGGYAGGRYVTSMPRDLSNFTALTFWAKGSQAASIDEIGFGHNAEGNKFITTLYGVDINTNWKKVIIPIATPSLLVAESGMLYYSEAPENGSGYTFWIDEVKFENLGTIAHPEPKILGGADETETSFVGVNLNIDDLSITYNMPDGVNQTVYVAPSYFDFHSSNESVATVDDLGQITLHTSGEAIITASVDGTDAEGSLTITSTGVFVPAPTPTADADDVISIFSDAYTNVPVDFYNGYWEPYQTTLSADFEVNGDNVLNYYNFNFVGIEFTSPAIDATGMTHLHLDVFVPGTVNPSDKLMLSLVDMGADGSINEPNVTFTYVIDGNTLQSQDWASVDIDLSGMSSKSNFFRIIMENDGSALSGFYLDNLYLYTDDSGGGATEPTQPAPTPTLSAGDVVSLYSDAYTDVTVDTWYTDWSVGGGLSDFTVGGNITKKYATLSYAGITTETSQIDASTMTHFHIDVWSADFSEFKVKLVDFGADGAYDGGDDVEHEVTYSSPAQGEWVSLDIPLTDFTGLTTMSNIAQYVISAGGGTIFIDNVYFHK